MTTESEAASQLSSGLPDEAFATDGLLTKRVLRAYALAMLAPKPGQLLWDLGAGSGSIAIEWCRLDSGARCVAVERKPDRLERLAVNAATHGLADRIEVVAGDLPGAIDQLPRPDAVFVGGGVTAELLRRCWQVLPAGGQLVAHSVTADSDAVLLEAYRDWGGELARVSVENAEPLGRFTSFKPLRTVTTWAQTRPATAG